MLIAKPFGANYNTDTASPERLSVFRRGFVVEINAVNADAAVICVAFDAFHAVVADLFRIQIAAVAFTAADAFPVIQNALSMFGHSGTPPLP